MRSTARHSATSPASWRSCAPSVANRRESLTQEAFSLPLAGGERACIWRMAPDVEPIGVVVHVPAFAEEMNKCRPMTARAARAMARAGFGVLTIDVVGTGDSAGDFGAATFESWIDDVATACDWAMRRLDRPLWLWATRAGAILASAASHRVPPAHAMALWQPVVSGRQWLTQWLRLRSASGLSTGAPRQEGPSTLRERLNAGEALEIAGYTFNSSLASMIDAAELDFARTVSTVIWREVTGTSPSVVSAAGQSRIDA